MLTRDSNAGVGPCVTQRSAIVNGAHANVAVDIHADGLQSRDDLAGLHLATEPKVLIECGNMRNATDAALLATAAFQQAVAHALAQALTRFLVGS